jgi:uncharacterized damage-inducible protein DinB
MTAEIQTLIERFRDMRGIMFKTMDGLNSDGLNWKPTRRDTNSLFVQATHLAGSERHWIHHVIGKQTIQRDRPAEFRARGDDIAALRATFAEIAPVSEAILKQLSTADLDAVRETNHGPSSLRWCVLHLLEHYAEHVGQMSLTRQVWAEQAKSKKRQAPSPKPGTQKKISVAKKHKVTKKVKRKT